MRDCRQKNAKRAAVAVVGLSVALVAFPARAQLIADISANIQSVSDLVFEDLQHVTVGLGPKFAPDYMGSDDYEFRPDLSFNVRFGNRFSASTQGVEFTLFGIQRITFGPTLRLSGRRSPDANPAVEGLGTIKRSPELGVFAKAVWPRQLSLRLGARQGIARGHEGLLVEMEGSAQVYRSRSGEVTGYVGASTTWAGSPYTRSFFGINEEQSVDSGLPVYDPGSSMRDVSLSATLRWVLSPHWSFNGTAGYRRLLDDVADSPIVSDYGSADQFSIGFILARTFPLN